MAAWLVLVVGLPVAAALGWWTGTRLARHRRDRTTAQRYGLAAAVLLVGSLLTVALGRVGQLDAVSPTDEAIYDWFVSGRGEFLTSLMRLVTEMGSLGANLMAAAIGGLLVFYRTRQWRPSLALPAVVGVVVVVNAVIDVIDDRPPPDGVDVIGEAGTYPSGGTARVLALALVAALILARRWGRPQDYQWLLAGAAVLGWLEAASRFILGKHWPMDLVGGIVLGATAAVAVAIVTLPGRAAVAGKDEPVRPAEGDA